MDFLELDSLKNNFPRCRKLSIIVFHSEEAQ